MTPLEFAINVIIISSSGVLSPGPLFFANILLGSRQGILSGINMAHGHASVEILVITMISFGVFFFSPFLLSAYTNIIGIVGGIGLLGFAFLQILSILKKSNIKIRTNKSPFYAGIILSALNPFFLIWWSTIGLKLIFDSMLLSGLVMGIVILFLFHIWMDYTWLALTAHIAKKSISFLGSRYYNIILIITSAALFYYGIYFIISSFA